MRILIVVTLLFVSCSTAPPAVAPETGWVGTWYNQNGYNAFELAINADSNIAVSSTEPPRTTGILGCDTKSSVYRRDSLFLCFDFLVGGSRPEPDSLALTLVGNDTLKGTQYEWATSGNGRLTVHSIIFTRRSNKIGT